MKGKFFSLFLVLICLTPALAHAGDLEWAAGMRVVPESPSEGEVTHFEATVEAGPRDAVDFRVVGGVDGKELFTEKFPLLKAGQRRVLRFEWKAVAGRHTAYCRIVPSGAAPYSARKAKLKAASGGRTKDPTRIEKRIIVKDAPSRIEAVTTLSPEAARMELPKQPECEGRPLPDIDVESISVSGSGMPGSTHDVNISIVNRGQCDTGPFTVSLEVLVQVPSRDIYETNTVGVKGVPSLKPCVTRSCHEASYSVSFSYKVRNDSPAHYEFSVEADGGDDVEEFNEKNNEIERGCQIDVK